MGIGVFLLILGAILAFATNGDVPGVNIHIVGVILMVAGAAIVHVARRGASAEKQVTTVHDVRDPDRPVDVVTEVVTEHDAPGNRHSPEL